MLHTALEKAVRLGLLSRNVCDLVSPPRKILKEISPLSPEQVHQFGTHLSPGHDVLVQLKKLLKKAGLPDIRFHDLRHSTATLLLSKGVHPKVVQEILGHSEISMTMDTYSHVIPTMQKDAMDWLNDIFGG